jgi:glycosyltransferase involved in cell wall biosynthesis
LTRFRVNFDALERLSSAEVVECYRACDVVVFPSTSEGFGMPVIEGQACGKPVVAGDIPVLREVAGDAACFVDPLDVASIRSGIHRVLDDVSFRQDLVRLGLRNAQRFAPNTMLRGYESAYVEVARAAARRGGRGSPARSRNLTESE